MVLPLLVVMVASVGEDRCVHMHILLICKEVGGDVMNIINYLHGMSWRHSCVGGCSCVCVGYVYTAARGFFDMVAMKDK